MSLVSRKPIEVTTGRMAQLKKLPLVFDLNGKNAIVVGDSERLTQKIETLLAAGASVTVYSSHTQTSDALKQLLARADHHLKLCAQDWRDADFKDAEIAVAEFQSRDQSNAELFRHKAKAHGCLVHIEGLDDFSDFSFAELINRDSVVFAVAASGPAKSELGHALRDRLDKLIPTSLSSWGKTAKFIKKALDIYAMGRESLEQFWSNFADQAMHPVAPKSVMKSAETMLIDYLGKSGKEDTIRKGKVTLVGAGPGDAELLTLKAVRALQSADIILFDDLVSDDVLNLARREAKRMMVGKRARRASCRQDDINALMVKLAGQGKHVVRLKSGDPMVFGRAGEEIAQLASHNIPVDVVPGLTAAVAMASSLGVSLTHRDHAHSVRFVTGHARNGELPNDLDWKGLADQETTTIFYMGGRTSSAIASRLLSKGLSSSTPVVAVCAISRPEEARWTGTLQELANGALQNAKQISDPANPVLIGIGDVFARAVMHEKPQTSDLLATAQDLLSS